METWVYLAAFYGIAKGIRECMKKAALKKSSIMEVLFLYTALAFIMLIPFSHNVFCVPPLYQLLIFAKSFVIFIAWICAFNSIKRMPVSLYGVIDSTRMLFSMILAVLFLSETITVNKAIGFFCVLSGVIAINVGHSNGEKIKFKFLVVALLNCLLNAISAIIDKKALSTGVIDSSQLQFWFMLYLTVFYLAYILIMRVPVKLSTLKTNYWIPVLSLLFVVADRLLFIANEYPSSQVTVMTLLKQSSVVVAVITGKFFFHEKQIVKRLICAAVVIAGITIATI